MPVTYAKGRYHIVDESRLAVAFVKRSTRSDGTAGDKQWFDHALGWGDSTFDAAKHLRNLDRDPRPSSRQSFAVPDDVCDDPEAYAEVSVVNSTGAILSDFCTVDSNTLSCLTRRWSSKP